MFTNFIHNNPSLGFEEEEEETMADHVSSSFNSSLNLVLITIFLLISPFLLPSAAASDQTCHHYTFSNNRTFTSCNDLPVLNSFIHWNYNTTGGEGTVDIAYRKTNTTSSRWVSWAINPNSAGMVGAQAFVAFQASNGVLRAYTSPIDNYRTRLVPGNLSFGVPSISAEFLNNEMIIFATLQLPNNLTTVNQLWQDGPLINDVPGRHEMSADHILSRKTLDFLSGRTTTIAPTTTSPIEVKDSMIESRIKRRNVHGVVNAVSWGVMMPTGAMVARYLKVFKSMGALWFYLHILTQSSAYVGGVAGWVTGLLLGSQSPGIQHDAHRTIGIILFSLGTLQVFALGLRPKPDHKYRLYWNLYHHCTGYIVIILSVVNVFKGFDILEPEKKWKTAYTGVIIALGVLTVVLECYTRMSKCAARKLAQASEANGTTKALPI